MKMKHDVNPIYIYIHLYIFYEDIIQDISQGHKES